MGIGVGQGAWNGERGDGGWGRTGDGGGDRIGHGDRWGQEWGRGVRAGDGMGWDGGGRAWGQRTGVGEALGQGKGPGWERARERGWGHGTGTRDRTGKGQGLGREMGQGVATGDGGAMWGSLGTADGKRRREGGRGSGMGYVGQRDAMPEGRSTRCVILLKPLPPCPQQHRGHLTAPQRSDSCMATPERPRGFG